MKIGIDVSRAFRKEKTGIEWYVYYLMYELARQDAKHEYIFYTNCNPNENVEEIISSRLRVLHWPFKRLWTQGRFSLEMIMNPPDVLLIPSSALPLIHPKKTIAVVHDVGFLSHTHYRSPFAISYLKWSTQYALKHAWKIVTVSEWTKQEIIRYYGTSAGRIHVVPIGLHDSYRILPNNESIEAVRKKYTIQRPFFLTIGRIDERKNIKCLIAGFKLFSHLHHAYQLVIVGPYGYGAERSIAAIESAKKDGYRIVHIPWIEEGEKRSLLAGCKAFVFPSLYEGFGIPVIEAQASRVPVITSTTTSLPEIAGKGAAYIDPQSALALAEQMEKVAVDRQFATDLVEKGYENSCRFTWEICASTIDSLLRDEVMC